MKLTSKVLCTSHYLGKSKFEFWQVLKPGDVLTVELVIKSLNGGGRIYSPTFTLYNGKLQFTCTNGELLNYLDKFHYTELNNE